MAINAKKIIFTIIALMMSVIIIESFALGALALLRNIKHVEYRTRDFSLTESQRQTIQRLLSEKNTYIDFDPKLGWSIRKNGRFGDFRANADGIRADREYSLRPQGDVLRIAAFGDSFTHGDEVKNDETWQRFMESRDTRLEVFNYGVPGYGVDQAYLRYLQEGKRYHPRIVFIGFMPSNYSRHVNTFRPFYHDDAGLPLSKPRFIMNDDRLELLDNPLTNINDYRLLLSEDAGLFRSLCKHDFYCQHRSYWKDIDALAFVRLLKLLKQLYFQSTEPLLLGYSYNESSDAYQVTAGIVESFYQQVLQDGAVPLIVIFPDVEAFNLYKLQGAKVYSDLLNQWQEAGYRTIDLLDHFLFDVSREELAAIFAPGGHYSASGNALVAEFLCAYVEKMMKQGGDND